MARRRAFLLTAVGAVLWTQPAGAQEGSGLYEPFPGPVTEERAVSFVRTMIAAAGESSRDAAVDAAALREGRTLDPAFAPAGGDGEAAGRANASSALGGSLGLFISLALALTLGVALPARLLAHG